MKKRTPLQHFLRTIAKIIGCIFVLYATPFTVSAQSITSVAGSGRSAIGPIGNPLQTNIGNPFGVEIGPDGLLYICEVDNHRLFRLDLEKKLLSVVAGTGIMGYAGDGGPATSAKLNEPYEVRFAENGDIYFVEMKNHLVRKITSTTGVISTIAGNGTQGYGGDGGPATKAQLSNPHSIALNRDSLFIADIGNHRIRRVDLKSGQIESVAGNEQRKLPIDGGKARDQPVLGPRALFLQGESLWVALREGHSVWRLNLTTETWHHLAGTGEKGYSGDGGKAKQATFNGPKGIAVGPNGNIFVVDTENQVIRVIDSKKQIISTLAGTGPNARGYRGDGGPASQAWLGRPHGICIDQRGRVFIGDSENHRVRLVE